MAFKQSSIRGSKFATKRSSTPLIEAGRIQAFVGFTSHSGAQTETRQTRRCFPQSSAAPNMPQRCFCGKIREDRQFLKHLPRSDAQLELQTKGSSLLLACALSLLATMYLSLPLNLRRVVYSTLDGRTLPKLLLKFHF